MKTKVLGWIKNGEVQPSNSNIVSIQPKDDKRPAINGSGGFEIGATPAKVWDLLLDPGKLADIIPGCEALETLDENKFVGISMLGVGPVKGRFEAKIELKDLERPYKATIIGSAEGPLGSSRGIGSFELGEIPSGTFLKYAYEVELSGTIASVGGRLLRGAARQLIDVFLHALARQAGDADGSDSLLRIFWLKLKNILGIGQ